MLSMSSQGANMLTHARSYGTLSIFLRALQYSMVAHDPWHCRRHRLTGNVHGSDQLLGHGFGQIPARSRLELGLGCRAVSAVGMVV
jgi:hypothetical protein